MRHKSDCSLYNEPAFRKGKCDCKAIKELFRNLFNSFNLLQNKLNQVKLKEVNLLEEDQPNVTLEKMQLIYNESIARLKSIESVLASIQRQSFETIKLMLLGFGGLLWLYASSNNIVNSIFIYIIAIVLLIFVFLYYYLVGSSIIYPAYQEPLHYLNRETLKHEMPNLLISKCIYLQYAIECNEIVKDFQSKVVKILTFFFIATCGIFLTLFMYF